MQMELKTVVDSSDNNRLGWSSYLFIDSQSSGQDHFRASHGQLHRVVFLKFSIGPIFSGIFQPSANAIWSYPKKMCCSVAQSLRMENNTVDARPIRIQHQASKTTPSRLGCKSLEMENGSDYPYVPILKCWSCTELQSAAL